MEDGLDTLINTIGENESSPLALVRRSSGRLNRGLSTASEEAAENLLNKALLRLDRPDPDLAAVRRLVRRALDLPYDDWEEHNATLWAVHMKLFMALSDDVEDCEVGDQSWLRRAEALIERSSPAAAYEIRSCLLSVADGVNLSAVEMKRVKKLTVGILADPDPLDDVPEGEAQVQAVIDVLQVFLDHERQLVEAAGELP